MKMTKILAMAAVAGATALTAGATGNYNSGGDATGESPSFLARCYESQRDWRGDYELEHTSVGAYLSNDWGLYDMHGNVSEWNLDWYAAIDLSAEARDSTGPSSGSNRIKRGGNFGYSFFVEPTFELHIS